VGGVDLAQRAGLVASTTLYSCQPPMPTTWSPTLETFGVRDSITSPTVPPIMTSPSGWAAA
jgi:hypothetical protein